MAASLASGRHFEERMEYAGACSHVKDTYIIALMVRLLNPEVYKPYLHADRACVKRQVSPLKLPTANGRMLTANCRMPNGTCPTSSDDRYNSLTCRCYPEHGHSHLLFARQFGSPKLLSHPLFVLLWASRIRRKSRPLSYGRKFGEGKLDTPLLLRSSVHLLRLDARNNLALGSLRAPTPHQYVNTLQHLSIIIRVAFFVWPPRQ
jgi:hypothetical protein